MFEGNSKGFKNWPICAKHASFAIGLSREQVARTLKTKILKNFLSVFRDWKFYPWGSLEISRKNLWVPLATGTSTCEQVTDLSRKKHKNPNFEKYSKYFSRLGHWLASEPWKISEWARVRSMLEIFDILIDEQAFGFLGIIHFILCRFPFFLVKY